MRRVLLACSLLLLPALCGCDGPSLLKAEPVSEWSAEDFGTLVEKFEALGDDHAAQARLDCYGTRVKWFAKVRERVIGVTGKPWFRIAPLGYPDAKRLVNLMPADPDNQYTQEIAIGDTVALEGDLKFFVNSDSLGIIEDAYARKVARPGVVWMEPGSGRTWELTAPPQPGESAEPTPRSFGVEHREEGRAYYQKPTADDIARHRPSRNLEYGATAVDHERAGHVWIEAPEQAVTSRDEDGTVRVEAKLGRYVDPATRQYVDNAEPYEGELPDSEQAD